MLFPSLSRSHSPSSSPAASLGLVPVADRKSTRQQLPVEASSVWPAASLSRTPARPHLLPLLRSRSRPHCRSQLDSTEASGGSFVRPAACLSLSLAPTLPPRSFRWKLHPTTSLSPSAHPRFRSQLHSSKASSGSFIRLPTHTPSETPARHSLPHSLTVSSSPFSLHRLLSLSLPPSLPYPHF